MLLELSAKVWIYRKRSFPKSGLCNIAAGVCFISFRFPEKWGYAFSSQDIFLLKTDIQDGYAPGGCPCRLGPAVKELKTTPLT